MIKKKVRKDKFIKIIIQKLNWQKNYTELKRN